MTTLGPGTIVPKPCPICSHPITLSPDDQEYIRCLKCGVVRTKYDYNSSLYGSSYAKTYLNYAKTSVSLPLNLFRLGLISRWLREGDRILDVGCCVGEFIRFAEKYYDCEGFEPNHKAAVEARKRVNSSIFTNLNGSSRQAHCVTLFDVIEHLQEPAEFLNKISRFLLPGGIVAITTPDVGFLPSWADDSLRKWKHWKPREHLFLFGEVSLEILLQKTGFEILHCGHEESDIRPGNENEDLLTCVSRKACHE